MLLRSLEELSGVIDEDRPRAFYEHIRNKDYGLSPEIPPDKRTLNQFRRFTGRAEGLGLGESATLGCAVAAHVAQGIGTTAGDYDLARIREYAGITATGAEIATTRRDAASGRAGW